MRFQYIRPAALLVLFSVMLLPACDPFGFAQVEAISLMGTDKTVVDHMVSYGSGKDCSMVRREQGLTYCVEDEKKVRQNIYCYRNLAGVTCYDRPDPHGGGQQRVDRNEHNMAK